MTDLSDLRTIEGQDGDSNGTLEYHSIKTDNTPPIGTESQNAERKQDPL